MEGSLQSFFTFLFVRYTWATYATYWQRVELHLIFFREKSLKRIHASGTNPQRTHLMHEIPRVDTFGVNLCDLEFKHKLLAELQALQVTHAWRNLQTEQNFLQECNTL